MSGRIRARFARPYEAYLESAVGEATSVLDLGCGSNSPLGRFRRRYEVAVGVDVYEDALAKARKARVHTHYEVLNVLDAADRFGEGSFDVVVAFDLIEHLTQSEGEKLLDEMERLARRRVVIFTPNGYLFQAATAGNPFQVHRSGWTPAPFRERGYRVYGVNGLRALRKEKGVLRWRPHRFWSLLSDFTQPLAYRLPSKAFHLLCVKDLAGQREAVGPDVNEARTRSMSPTR